MRFESLYYSNDPINGTFLRFFPASAGLLDYLSKWMVLPDFYERYGILPSSSFHWSVIIMVCFWVSGA